MSGLSHCEIWHALEEDGAVLSSWSSWAQFSVKHERDGSCIFDIVLIDGRSLKVETMSAFLFYSFHSYSCNSLISRTMRRRDDSCFYWRWSTKNNQTVRHRTVRDTRIAWRLLVDVRPVAKTKEFPSFSALFLLAWTSLQTWFFSNHNYQPIPALLVFSYVYFVPSRKIT